MTKIKKGPGTKSTSYDFHFIEVTNYDIDSHVTVINFANTVDLLNITGAKSQNTWIQRDSYMGTDSDGGRWFTFHMRVKLLEK